MASSSQSKVSTHVPAALQPSAPPHRRSPEFHSSTLFAISLHHHHSAGGPQVDNRCRCPLGSGCIPSPLHAPSLRRPPSASTSPRLPSAVSTSPRPSSTPPTAFPPPPPSRPTSVASAAAASASATRCCATSSPSTPASTPSASPASTRPAAAAARVRLAAALSLNISKYEKAARELAAAAAGPASPAEELRRAGVRAELTRTPAASLRERVRQVLDEGSARCLVLVSGRQELASLLPVAKERGVRSVVVGGESGLARLADVGFSWADVVRGKARNAAPSVSGKWRDRDMLKALEWKYEGDDDDEEVVFEGSDEDEVDELMGRAKGKPWWKLDSDGEDAGVDR
ncbi:hypothetical protein PR202_gb15366 [Eleusine coracana subsp. coracana]|uniref:Uncharacterized protein n=1 Tax=Eleusine coracana subsp. coracana TaxID=191504 RepID=A0AAV5EXQ6_ELECO|nr:hypothetical protein PR202_gb15366 [Eleusine coracana subsp. coracana]